MSTARITYHGYEGCPSIELPQSKSMAARAMMLAAYLGAPLPALRGDECDDITHLHDALVKALAPVDDDIDIGSSGTAMRFMLSFLSLRREGAGRRVLRGSEQVQGRPIGSLVDTLRTLGAEIEYLGEEGYLPVAVTPQDLRSDDVTEVDTSESSQYMSSLMLLACAVPGGLKLRMDGKGVSYSYILMTIEMLSRAGIEVLFVDGIIEVKRGGRELKLPGIEADWSAAGYFYEAIALSPPGSTLMLPGLLPFGESVQGDSRMQRIFAEVGVDTTAVEGGLLLTKVKRRRRNSRPVEESLKSIPDALPALSATFCGLHIPYNFDGLSHLRYKESDRLSTLGSELYSVGYRVHASATGLVYNGWPRRPRRRRVISSHDDHRIVMAIAPLAVLNPLEITGAEAIEKSFPSYFAELEKVGYGVEVF